jgi:hypothetical protein
MAALSLAATLGVNVTMTAQLPLAARLLPQLFACPKSAAFAPEKVMGFMVTATVPVFVIVTGTAELVLPIAVAGKVIARGDQVRRVPIPMRFAGCGLPGSESVTNSVAVRAPALVGVNRKAAVQVAPAAREFPQALVT